MAKQTLLSGDTLPSMTVKVNSMFGERYDHDSHNVLNYGAAGDDTTDDTDEFEAAIAAATASGGRHVVKVPGGRTYKISRQITVPSACRIEGLGVDPLSGASQAPRLSWYGAANETMFLVDAGASPNITSVVFKDLNLWSGQATRCGGFIKYYSSGGGGYGKVDTGCYLENVGFYGCTEHAVYFADGATNMYINGCRWDFCGSGDEGYGIYVNLYGGFNCHLFGQCTYTCEDGAGGFLHLDAEGQSASSLALVKIDALKIEVNDNHLAETYSSGANPYDKRGLIRLSVDDEVGPTSHHIICDALSVEAASDSVTGASSFCVFQVTGEAASDEIASWFVNIIVDMGTGLGQAQAVSGTPTGDDAHTIGEIRPIGGRVPTAWRPGAPIKYSSRWARFQVGQGQPDTTNRVVSWIYAPSYYVSHINFPTLYEPIVQSLTYAQLGTGSEGMLAWCTDVPSAVAFGAAVTSGTSPSAGAKRLLIYTGSSWINYGLLTP